MKRIIIIALAVITAVSVAIPVFAATADNSTPQTSDTAEKPSKNCGQHKKEKVAEPENAVGQEAAEAAALKDAGIAADTVEKIRTRVSQLDDGTVVYKVGFTAGDKYYSYKINALTGAVAQRSEMSAEEHKAAESDGKRGKKGLVAKPENAIGKDAAVSAALKDLGITADDADRIMTRLSQTDDGTVVYRVGINAGDKHYSVRVNALTGAIADKSEMSIEEFKASRPQHKGPGKQADDTADSTDS